MARGRMIRPEFWTDEKVNKLTAYGRLAFIGLWNFSDDWGEHQASIRKLIGEVFPHDDGINESMLAVEVEAMLRLELIEEFDYKGGKCWRIKNWAKHQKIENPSKYRVCMDTRGDSRGDTRGGSLKDSEDTPPKNPSKS
jgi:hypothetical protein